ncbi:hypothetical protein [Pseudomonas sp. GM_Psu_2]|uniref:hypothetical protein n=1 Tax=unclassified Pseudomonas TaxID=196821 RepID=UPI00226A3589|nr:hypothetical protein [Pseudomonas sp. GM_Psu_2]
MNNNPHSVVQVSTEPFNFHSLGVHPSLNARGAIHWRLKAAFDRHEMPGKTGEVGPPASGSALFAPLHSRYALKGCLTLRGASYRQQKREAKSMKRVQSEATRKSSPSIKVYCIPDKKAHVGAVARNAGKTASSYLPLLGMGYEVGSVIDAYLAGELVKINADRALGRTAENVANQ